MALSDRLNKIIDEQNISKLEFARRIGVTKNYIYILTGNSRKDTNQNKVISPKVSSCSKRKNWCFKSSKNAWKVVITSVFVE